LLSSKYSLRHSRLAYGLAQLGSRANREYTRSLLLEQSDLPSEGWRLLGERMWRTGIFGRSNDIWQRARSSGTFTAVRSFDEPAAPRWVLIKVSPVASVRDAEDLVPLLFSLSVPNPNVKVAVTSEGPVVDVSVAGVSHPWVYEQSTIGMTRGPTLSRFIGGSVDDVAFLVTCSGYRDAWPWDEVSSIAARQAAKLRSRSQNSNGV
jgi:hypothetical protein